MRELTKEELVLVPDWATHYWILDDKVMFESVAHFQLLDGIVLSERYNNAAGYITSMAVEIKGNQFDISKHEWSDDGVDCARVIDSELFIDDRDYGISSISISKQDAIAIAKHFGLTEGDLK